jgi:hypothetical protein
MNYGELIRNATGRINKHKEQKEPTGVARHKYSSTRGNITSKFGWPYSTVRGRGGRSTAQPHRNRSLVVKRGGSGNTSDQGQDVTHTDLSADSMTGQNGWVSTRSRHAQLINTSVYEKESTTRAKAMEQTRRQHEQARLQKKDLSERMKLDQHLQRTFGTPQIPSTKARQAHYVSVDGLQFQVCNGGSKLERRHGKEYH